MGGFKPNSGGIFLWASFVPLWVIGSQFHLGGLLAECGMIPSVKVAKGQAGLKCENGKI